MNPIAKLAWRFAWLARSGHAGGLEVGKQCPDFELKDVDGRAHRLSGFAGHRVVLWFTNLCEDCRSKAPLLSDLRRRGVGRVVVLAVSILAPNDPLPFQFAPSCGFPILIDPEDVVGARPGLSHPPGTCPMNNLFILDGRGTVLFRSHLSAISEARFRDICARLMGV